MQEELLDMSRELTLDANSIAGLLQEIFGADMTVVPAECASCGNRAEIGTLLAFLHGPGYVLRCSTCKQIVLRIVETPDSIIIDARGAAFLRIKRDRG